MYENLFHDDSGLKEFESKGKTSLDICAFNVAVQEYKLRHSDKSLADIEKLLVILGKMTDMAVFQPTSNRSSDLLVNCKYEAEAPRTTAPPHDPTLSPTGRIRLTCPLPSTLGSFFNLEFKRHKGIA